MLPKRFQQDPDNVHLGEITDVSLAVIATIERYKLIPSSVLVSLVGGNERSTQRHLHKLFHHDYLKRFTLQFVGGNAHLPDREMIYYLDNRKTLEELVRRSGVQEQSLDWTRVRTNRERYYMLLNDTDPRVRERVRSRLNTIDHELDISRFHGMLELACRKSGGATQLTSWRQGSRFHRKVQAPEILYNRRLDPPDWEEGEQLESLNWGPDALFTLAFAQSEGEEFLELGFAYERQRTTHMGLDKLLRKYRAHMQFVIQDKPMEHFGIKRLRAVLTETPDAEGANYLRKLTRRPVVSKKPGGLFLFTSSEFFTKLDEIQEGEVKKQVPRFWHKPETIFGTHWYTPLNNTPISFLDH